ncbi:MAG: thymidylate kinase-like protein [Kouleothrix sp.]|nr:thymidylate kinase-like protein [Kouleothrix sp.]
MKRLIAHLEALGKRPRHLWLRFPFFVSIPLLVYARLRGYSWHEESPEGRHGYWDFGRSRLLRSVLPWLLVLDAWLAAVRRVYIPLWDARPIVCERFVIDMLVDLAVAFDDVALHQTLPGQLLVRLIPHEAVVIVLDLDAQTVRARRADLIEDRRLEAKLAMFRQVSQAFGFPVLSSTLPVAEVDRRIQETIGAHNGY